VTVLSGWGRFPRLDCSVKRPRTEDDLRALTRQGRLIPRGNGRAYGDSALSATNTADMRSFARMLSFDGDTGRLSVEAGVLLADVIRAFLPRGWFPAVTPGTKFVTVGGMIAADVHGKNHHKVGSFGSFVDWIDVMGPDGSVRRCSREQDPELFGWTLGGMGLTGAILRAAFRLQAVDSGWIRQTTVPAPDLDTAMDSFERNLDATYSVAWIDCLSSGAKLGRSLVYLGEHATRAELGRRELRDPIGTLKGPALAVPFDAPSGLLNGVAVRAFNALYYRNGRRGQATKLVDWDSYFYPLDRVLGWNRIYGRRGFAQFQCALPLDRSRDGLRALLDATSRAGAGSFLAVLKRFGEQDSPISFPMAGYTLALDFPVTRKTLALLAELDRIAIEHGGRFYLAKDSRMTAAALADADARIPGFVAMRRTTGCAGAFSSAQSERLAL
jgi:decaprenylphospho-beta-D-ribofuranose 2-oxidase